MEKQGQRAGCFFWPGSEAPIQGIRPTYYMLFNDSMPNSERVTGVLKWFQLPLDERPNFVTLYMSITDTYGHTYGPDSPMMDVAFRDVDNAIGQLVQGLTDLRLYDSVNLIVTADHGMTALNVSRIIFIEEIIDLSTVDIIDWSPIAALIPHEGCKFSFDIFILFLSLP